MGVSKTEGVFQLIHLIHKANSFIRDCGAGLLREVKRGTLVISAELLTVIVSVEKLGKNYNLNKKKEIKRDGYNHVLVQCGGF